MNVSKLMLSAGTGLVLALSGAGYAYTPAKPEASRVKQGGEDRISEPDRHRRSGGRNGAQGETASLTR